VHSRMAAPVVALMLLLAACSGGSGAEERDGGDGNGREPVDPIAVPELGACRALEPADIAQPHNEKEPVDCSEPHTAETFAVGTFPDDVVAGGDFDAPELGAYVYKTCTKKFERFLGGDESLVMRSMLTWAWFRPSPDAWEKGARWYRCDAVSGTEQSEELRALPETARGILAKRDVDSWMTCAVGETVSGSQKVPCTDPHDWRAVTTIKVGGDKDPYHGDRLVEVRSREYCSDSVGAWMNYPVDYEFGYTYFKEAEWEAGNRRTICWARTDK